MLFFVQAFYILEQQDISIPQSHLVKQSAGSHSDSGHNLTQIWKIEKSYLHFKVLYQQSFYCGDLLDCFSGVCVVYCIYQLWQMLAIRLMTRGNYVNHQFQAICKKKKKTLTISLCTIQTGRLNAIISVIL